MPTLCSAEAAAISFMIELTRAIDWTISVIVVPDWSTSSEPDCTRGGRLGDQSFDLLGGAGAALRKRAHLARDHREATSLLARAGGFHRCVQRQNIGLKSDAFDHPDDIGDLVRITDDVLHRAHHLLRQLTAFDGEP
jgi:hypothetical protein